MARSTFGGSAADAVWSTVPSAGYRLIASLTGQSATMWSQASGGVQYTDLFLDGNPVTSVPVGAGGILPEFQGPDGITTVWADAGGGFRARLDAPGFIVSTSTIGFVLGASSGTDDTSTINTALGTTGIAVIRGTPGQNYLISAPLVVRSGTTLDMTGCTVTLKAGSNCNMVNNTAVGTTQRAIAGSITAGSANFTLTTGTATAADVGRTFVIAGAGPNAGGFALTATVVTFTDATHVVLDTAAGHTVAAAATTVYDRDHDIAVIGGAWNRGSNGGTGAAQHSFFLRHVDNLTVDLESFTSTGVGPKYAVHPGDVTNFALRVRSFDHVSDGIHVRGPATRGVIWGVGGTTGDDFVVLGSSDSSRVSEGAGEISDVDVYDLRPVDLSTAIFKVYGNTGTTLRGIHLNGVRGGSADKGLQLGATDITGCTLDDITVENVRTNASAPVNINARCSGGPVRLKNLTATDATVTDVLQVVNVIAGVAVDRLEVESVSAPSIGSTAAGGAIVNVAGTVTDLVVDKGKYTLPSSGATVLLSGASARVDRAQVNDVTQTNGGALVKAATSGQTLGEVWMSDCYLTGASFLGDFNTATTVHMSGVVLVSPGNGAFIFRASSSVKLYGDGNVLPAVPASTVSAGAVVTSYTSDVPYLSTAGAVPTVTAGTGAGTSPTVSVVGNDHTGTITVTTGTAPSANTLVSLNLTRGLAASIRQVLITPTNAAAAAVQPYVSSKAFNRFDIAAKTAPAASTAHTFDYLVIA